MLKTIVLFFMATLGVAQVTTTVAGAPWVFPSSANGGPAINAPLISIAGVAADSAGNIFAADSGNNFVVKITTAGVLTIVAGTGVAGVSADGFPATGATLSGPSAVALDSSGNLYLNDGNRVRKVTPDGIISTVAGNGSSTYYGFNGDGGPAIYAYLNNPHSLAFDSAGNLYIAVNEGVRKVDANGIITTVINAHGLQSTGAQLGQPGSIALDAKGALYISDLFSKHVWKADASGNLTAVAGNGQSGLSGDGGPATSAELESPGFLAFDPTGNLIIADSQRIRKVTREGVITTVAQLNAGQALIGDDSSGNLYLGGSQLFKLSPTGVISLLAGSGTQRFFGDGGPATNAQLFYANGLVADLAGNLYIADSGNSRIRQVTPSGIIRTVAGTTPGFSGDGGSAVSAQLANPQGIAVDGAGNLYIADQQNQRIRMVAVDGTITTLAGNGTAGYSGDSGPAKDAQLNYPAAVAVDASGNLYIADALNFRVRKVTADGNITTVAGAGQAGFSGDNGPAVNAQIESPSAVALDSAGNLYIVDSNVWNGIGLSNQRVRKVDTKGVITTFAGNGTGGFSGDRGPAIRAELCYPQGIAVDPAGNVYILDSGNDSVRKVDQNGTITTVPNLATVNLATVGLNLSAHDYLKSAGAIAADSAGSVYISDFWNNRILKVTGPAPPFFVSNGVVSAASLVSSSGVLAPGGIVSIFGLDLATGTQSSAAPLPPSLLDTAVTIAGLPAPLLFVSAGQINLQVPFEAPLGSVPVKITRTSMGSASLVLPLSAVAPGIFTLGNSQGAILTSTGEVAGPGVSVAGLSARPARRGEFVSIYLTGLGDVTNRPASGAPAPGGSPYSETILTPTIMIGDAAASPTFSGLAPLFAGLYQVNVQVPESSATGDAVQVTLQIGAAISNTVTMAVQ